jgi:hypothetical protein
MYPNIHIVKCASDEVCTGSNECTHIIYPGYRGHDIEATRELAVCVHTLREKSDGPKFTAKLRLN